MVATALQLVGQKYFPVCSLGFFSHHLDAASPDCNYVHQLVVVLMARLVPRLSCAASSRFVPQLMLAMAANRKMKVLSRDVDTH